jgi:hypothetical protein
LQRALRKLDRNIDHLGYVPPDLRKSAARWGSLDWLTFTFEDFSTLSQDVEEVHEHVHERLADLAEIKAHLSPGQLRLGVAPVWWTGGCSVTTG